MNDVSGQTVRNHKKVVIGNIYLKNYSKTGWKQNLRK